MYSWQKLIFSPYSFTLLLSFTSLELSKPQPKHRLKMDVTNPVAMARGLKLIFNGFRYSDHLKMIHALKMINARLRTWDLLVFVYLLSAA